MIEDHKVIKESNSMSILDLNVDSTCVEKMLQSDSKTSNNSSSVLNPIDEDSSTNNSSNSPFTFDLLKKEKSDLEIVTKTLFPVIADRGGRVFTDLKKTFTEIDEENGVRNLQQKQSKVRKSRRGPRSRSSQFRGVTFYRRTGRWESHIWYVI